MQLRSYFFIPLFLALFTLTAWGQDEVTPPTQSPSIPRRIWNATASGINTFRVQLIADDQELAGLHQLIEEGEHAVEPPMEAEGFLRRKAEILKSFSLFLDRELPPVFDLRRSFENVIRLANLSKTFDTPAVRDLLVSSAVMFGITHGTEFLSGVSMGSYHFFHGHWGQSSAWFGLAIPGLYDVGCWIGQGVLLLRPGRTGFTAARKFVVRASGEAVRRLGLQHSLNHLFHRDDFRQYLARVENSANAQDFKVTIPNETLQWLTIRDAEENEIMRLKFEPGSLEGEHLLTEGVFSPKFRHLSFSEISPWLKHLRWNVRGAVRQIHTLLKRDQSALLEHEKTFISSIESSDGTHHIQFRKESVWVRPAIQWKKSLCALIFSSAK